MCLALLYSAVTLAEIELRLLIFQLHALSASPFFGLSNNLYSEFFHKCRLEYLNQPGLLGYPKKMSYLLSFINIHIFRKRDIQVKWKLF